MNDVTKYYADFLNIPELEIRDIRQQDIDYIVPKTMDDKDKEVYSKLGWNFAELAKEAISGSIYSLVAVYKNTPLFIAGVFNEGYKGNKKLWLIPDKFSEYKFILTKIARKMIQLACRIHGILFAFDLKECPKDIRWLEVLGGEKIDEAEHNGAVFCIMQFKEV